MAQLSYFPHYPPLGIPHDLCYFLIKGLFHSTTLKNKGQTHNPPKGNDSSMVTAGGDAAPGNMSLPPAHTSTPSPPPSLESQ